MENFALFIIPKSYTHHLEHRSKDKKPPPFLEWLSKDSTLSITKACVSTTLQFQVFFFFIFPDSSKGLLS